MSFCSFARKMNCNRKLRGYEELDENYPKGVTPECFNRGSSSGFAWIPA
jgi:hypothetical protein